MHHHGRRPRDRLDYDDLDKKLKALSRKRAPADRRAAGRARRRRDRIRPSTPPASPTWLTALLSDGRGQNRSAKFRCCHRSGADRRIGKGPRASGVQSRAHRAAKSNRLGPCHAERRETFESRLVGTGAGVKRFQRDRPPIRPAIGTACTHHSMPQAMIAPQSHGCWAQASRTTTLRHRNPKEEFPAQPLLAPAVRGGRVEPRRRRTIPRTPWNGHGSPSHSIAKCCPPCHSAVGLVVPL